jgi:hypothetical protein
MSTTMAGNTAAQGGGAVNIASAEFFDMGNSTVSGNQAQGSDGGGLWINSMYEQSHIFNSTISGNTTSGKGGGIYFHGYYGLALTESTITANTADTVGGVFVPGPDTVPAAAHARKGAHSQAAKPAKHSGAAEVEHRAHAKAAHGGAKAAAASVDTVSVVGSIVSGNSGDDLGDAGTFTADHSLIGKVSGTSTFSPDAATTALLGVDPMLGPLAANGGPTQTHALLLGSPAINAGPDPVPAFSGNEFDQRGPGFARVVAGVVDIGAFEVQPPPIVLAPRFTG